MAGQRAAGYGAELRFRIGDGVVVAVVLLCALALAAACLLSVPGGTQVTVQVYQGGVLLWEHPLAEDGSFHIAGEGCPYENHILIRDGRVCIQSATCPGEDCVRMGWLSQPGQSIFCLPNRVEVRLTGSSGVDAVVG